MTCVKYGKDCVMHQNKKCPFKRNRLPKYTISKYKATNNMMSRRYWTNATITLKTDIILNRAFANKLDWHKLNKRILSLLMVIRNNQNILYFTKYIHIKNGWRI